MPHAGWNEELLVVEVADTSKLFEGISQDFRAPSDVEGLKRESKSISKNENLISNQFYLQIFTRREILETIAGDLSATVELQSRQPHHVCRHHFHGAVEDMMAFGQIDGLQVWALFAHVFDADFGDVVATRQVDFAKLWQIECVVEGAVCNLVASAEVQKLQILQFVDVVAAVVSAVVDAFS